MVPMPSSALSAIIAIAIPGVVCVLVIAILVIATHVVVKPQYTDWCAIKPQVVGDRVAIPWMKIERNVGTRRRSNGCAGGGGGSSARPIATRSKNCMRIGGALIKPTTSYF